MAPNGINIDLFNNKRAPIDFEILAILVKQHKTDPNFFIEIRVDGPGVYVEQSEVSNFKINCTLYNVHCTMHIEKSDPIFFLLIAESRKLFAG